MDKEIIKERAEIYFRHKKSLFIRTTNGNFYFCNVLDIDEDFIYVENFAGKRKGMKDDILIIDVDEIQEYREMGAEV